MTPQYINNTLTPPEYMPTNKELEREVAEETFERDAVRFVRENKQPGEVFDLYDHDKKISNDYLEWVTDGFTRLAVPHAWELFSDEYAEMFNLDMDKIYTTEEIWELYCNKPENKQQ